MLYLHDVWVNWFIEEENGYNVCEFHEWRKDEKYELLDQVPLLTISSELFDYILNGLNPIPNELLVDIKEKSFKRVNHNAIQMKHCFVLTDGFDVLAVDTMDLNIPSKKSRVVPRTYALIMEMMRSDSIREYSFEEIPRKYNLCSLEPKCMMGLTRRERNLKQLLGRITEKMENDSVEKIHYYFSEWDNESYKKNKNLSQNKLWKNFSDSIMGGWSEKHEIILKDLIQHEPSLKEIYIKETIKNMR